MANETIHSLMNGGDWACAHADAHALADVCHELAGKVRVDLAPDLEALARVAEDDMEAASGGWLELSRRLRRLSGGDRAAELSPY